VQGARGLDANVHVDLDWRSYSSSTLEVVAHLDGRWKVSGS